MKKALIFGLALLALGTAGCRKTAPAPEIDSDGGYITDGTVISVTPLDDGDTVEIETVAGHVYAIQGWGFEIGDPVGIMLDSKFTPDPTDDTVYDAWLK